MELRQLLAITGAMADENRLRALVALAQCGEMCVCQVVELLGLAPSTVSKHISILHQAGLLEMRKQGRWAFYRLAGGEAPPAVRDALEWVTRAVKDEPRAKADCCRVKEILKENPEELCRRQMGRSKCCSSAPATPAAARWRKAGRERSRAT
jgi:DNA-binding transcriptional ArsR family regulator